MDLGPEYGKVHVAGQPLTEIQRRVEVHVERNLKEAQVLVSLPKTKQQISGKHLVRPDGTVELGIYGDVFLAGMTLSEAKKAIERQLQQHIPNPQVSVGVHSNNSKAYYVTCNPRKAGLQVHRQLCTGNDTVLDAIAKVEAPDAIAETRHIWIARPNPDAGGAAQLLHVDWDALSNGRQTDTNYQIFPGDRLHIGSEFSATLKFETDRTRNGNRLLAGQFFLSNAPESPVDVEFTLPLDTGLESPIGHMIAIPVQERVWLLTLGTKRPDADSAAVLPGSSDLGKSIIVEASDAIDEVLEVAPDLTVRCAVGATVKLQHTSRIKAVYDFDCSVLNVSPIQGEEEYLTVRSLADGGTQIRIVDEHDAEYLVKVLSLKFSGLDIYLKHLFPNEDIEVWPIQGVALLRGTVKSELQKEYVVDVAQQFYPGILNQLSVGSHSTSRPRKTDRPFIIDIDPAASSVVKITAENSSLVISSDHSRTLVFPERIRSVRSLNSEQVKVEPVQGAADSMTIYGRQNGVTKITVTGEDDRRYTVTVVVEHGVQEISLLAGQLYPNLNLSFSFVKSAIVVRGAVETEAQRQQIRDIVGQYAPMVLD